MENLKKIIIAQLVINVLLLALFSNPNELIAPPYNITVNNNPIEYETIF
jgi:hypothetical protein